VLNPRSADAILPEKLSPTARTQVANIALSFSELKYLFECPYQFKLRFLYGFNPPLAEALGTASHCMTHWRSYTSGRWLERF